MNDRLTPAEKAWKTVTKHWLISWVIVIGAAVTAVAGFGQSVEWFLKLVPVERVATPMPESEPPLPQPPAEPTDCRYYVFAPFLPQDMPDAEAKVDVGVTGYPPQIELSPTESRKALLLTIRRPEVDVYGVLIISSPADVLGDFVSLPFESHRYYSMHNYAYGHKGATFMARDQGQFQHMVEQYKLVPPRCSTLVENGIKWTKPTG